MVVLSDDNIDGGLSVAVLIGSVMATLIAGWSIAIIKGSERYE